VPEKRGLIAVKGKGEMETWFLNRRNDAGIAAQPVSDARFEQARRRAA
jgi:hypothetical protein